MPTDVEIRDELARLGYQREQADDQARAALARIRELIPEGKKAGLGMREMAELAGISRETAHKFLRDQATT